MPTQEAGANKRVSFSQTSRKIPAGVFETPAFVVPDDIDTCKITITRESWPVVADEYILRCQIYVTYDDVTWHLLMGFTTPGGDVFDKLGRLMTQSTVKRHIKPGIGRKVKAVVQCKAALTASVKVEGW